MKNDRMGVFQQKTSNRLPKNCNNFVVSSNNTDFSDDCDLRIDQQDRNDDAHRTQTTEAQEFLSEIDHGSFLQSYKQQSSISHLKFLFFILVIVSTYFFIFLNIKSIALDKETKYLKNELCIIKDKLQVVSIDSNDINNKTNTINRVEVIENVDNDLVEYVVRRGDTLSSISKFFYGVENDFDKIKEYNKLSDEGISEGQKLLIPKAPSNKK